MNKAHQFGVLLVNLGTPENLSYSAVTQFLTEFLLDRHVVDLPALFWKPLLTKIILPRRIPNTINNYKKIWLSEGSPLWVYSQQLTQTVAAQLPDISCKLAMTYGQPNLMEQIERLKYCDRIRIIPMFPQYSTTTTLPILNKIKQITANWVNPPYIEYIHDYANESLYITALTDTIVAHVKQHGIPDTLLLSYHGIPIKYIRKRQDSYLTRCELTTHILKQQLQKYGYHLEIMHSYQSQFGKGEWSKPDTTTMLTKLAAKGSHHVAVVCPGFAVDCVETLEEIATFNREKFIQSGGTDFYYISALNNSAAHVSLLLHLINHASALPLSPP
jgi:protoporphyrin/coproporphyrin ferrochelatase